MHGEFWRLIVVYLFCKIMSPHHLTTIDVCRAVVVFSSPPGAANVAPRRQKVVKKELTPTLARRACGNPAITAPILSREITKAVNARAEAVLGQHRAADSLHADFGCRLRSVAYQILPNLHLT